MMHARKDARVRTMIGRFALYSEGKSRLRIAQRVQNCRESKCQQKDRERIGPSHGWYAQRISLSHAHLDGGRLVDRLLRSVVLRQPPVHHPSAHGQHHENQTHTERSAKRALSRMHPGVAWPLHCRVVVRV